MHRWLAKAYLQTGKHREAPAVLSRAVELSATSAVLLADLAHAYSRAGNRQESLRHARELQEFSKTKYVSPYDSARVHLGLGEKDQAFAFLEKAFQERNSLLIYLKLEPELDPLRSDARFADLLRRVGLPP